MNLRQGRGIQIYENGSRYDGFWKNDKPEGRGRLINHNGDYYNGYWVNGLHSGFGVF